MISTYVSTFSKALKSELKEIHQTLFPISIIERIFLLFFFLLYGFIGIHILYHTELLDMASDNAGSYLGYDNLYYLQTRGGRFDFSHPFFNVFHILKSLIISLFSTLWNAKTSTAFCLFITNLLTIGGLLFIYRYLKQIIGISTARALLLTLLTGFFFTTIVLSFTIETYTFSFFLLTLSLLMISREYKLTGCIRGRTIFFFSFLCGGITITNAIKPVMAVFLNKASFFHKLRTGLKIILPFMACVFLFIALYTIKNQLLTPDESSPIERATRLNTYFIYEKTFGKQALFDFWGNTVMSTPLTLQAVEKEVVLRPSEYLYNWQTGAMLLLLILITASACLTIRNKYVQLLLLYLGIDFVIHFILRYGMNEAIIFGGHWMYIIPFLLGWLYTRLSNRLSKALDWILLIFLLLVTIQNCLEFMRLWGLYRIE